MKMKGLLIIQSIREIVSKDVLLLSLLNVIFNVLSTTN